MTATIVDPSLCEMCYRCTEACPNQAIRIVEGPAINKRQADEEEGRSSSFRDRAAAAIHTLTNVAPHPSNGKRRAEYMAKVVLDLTPNLVIMVNRELCIVSMSLSAERVFGCKAAAMHNRPLADILCSIDDFVRARDEKRIVKNRVSYRPDLIVEETVVPALEDDMIVAIMRDVTAEEKRREELTQVAQETIRRTQEVIYFQMQVAHEIASLLGETTAESKIQLGRLIQLVRGLEGIDVS